MKQDIKKRYVPYGINGLFYIYDNYENQIPIGYGSKYGTKKKIQSICNQMNQQEIKHS